MPRVLDIASGGYVYKEAEVNANGDTIVATGALGQARSREIVLAANTRASVTWVTSGITDIALNITAEPLSESLAYATAAAGSAAVITIAGVAGKSIFLNHVQAGYGTAGIGTLTITDGTTTAVYATSTTRDINFNVPFKAATGATVTITLLALAATVPYVSAGYYTKDYGDYLAIAFTAPNDATAEAWLLATNSATADSQRDIIPIWDGPIVYSRRFTRTLINGVLTGILRVDLISTRPLRIVIGAV